MLSHDRAYAVVEIVYDCLAKQGRVPTKTLMRLFASQDVELALKKGVIIQLNHFFTTAYAYNGMVKRGCHVEMFPSIKWYEVLSWLEQAGVDRKGPEYTCWNERLRFQTPDMMGKAQLLLERIHAVALFIGVPFYLLTRVRRVRLSKPRPKRMQLAVRMKRNDWGLNGKGTREIDWPLDGKRLSRKNTIFVSETELSPEYEAEIRRRGYKYTRCSPSSALRSTTLQFLLTLIFGRPTFVALLGALRSLGCPANLVIVAAKGFFEYFRWRNFVDQWQPQFYLTYNDMGVSHIFRNIILRKNGCICVCYQHSNSSHQIYEFKKTYSGKHVDWAYMLYDREIHWCRQQVDLWKSQFDRSSEVVAYGPIWASHVHSEESLNEKIRSRWPERNRVIIAIFNSSYGAGAVNRERDHLAFLSTFLELLDRPESLSLKIIFKPKKSYENYLQRGGVDLVAVVRKLQAHPDVLILPTHISASAVIAVAHLTISMPYASPTIEALYSGRRAFFYDACNRHPWSYYDRFPKLVAHSRERFFQYLAHWQQLSDEQLQAYVKDNLEPEFGGDVSQDPVERIRAYLSSSRPIQSVRTN